MHANNLTARGGSRETRWQLLCTDYWTLSFAQQHGLAHPLHLYL